MEDETDIYDGLPKPSRIAAERAMDLIDAEGGAGHIDMKVEEARLRERGAQRDRRGMEAFDGLRARRYSDGEIREILERAGAFDGLAEDMQSAAALRLIRLARQRRN
jgi:hypothetical protein